MLSLLHHMTWTVLSSSPQDQGPCPRMMTSSWFLAGLLVELIQIVTSTKLPVTVCHLRKFLISLPAKASWPHTPTIITSWWPVTFRLSLLLVQRGHLWQVAQNLLAMEAWRHPQNTFSSENQRPKTGKWLKSSKETVRYSSYSIVVDLGFLFFYFSLRRLSLCIYSSFPDWRGHKTEEKQKSQEDFKGSEWKKNSQQDKSWQVQRSRTQ